MARPEREDSPQKNGRASIYMYGWGNLRVFVPLRRFTLSNSIIAMMQPTKAAMRNDATSSHRANSAPPRFLPESEMCALFVVVADVFREQPFQMAFFHRDDEIQQIAPAALDPSFRDSVLPWALERSSHTPDSHRPNCGWYFRPILRIAVEDEKPWSRLKRKRFPQLLDAASRSTPLPLRNAFQFLPESCPSFPARRTWRLRSKGSCTPQTQRTWWHNHTCRPWAKRLPQWWWKIPG